MKKIFLTAFTAFFIISANAQTDVNMGIIPAPVSVQKGTGSFVLDKSVVLLSSNPKNAKIAETLKSFAATKGLTLRILQTVAAGQKWKVGNALRFEQRRTTQLH